MCVLPLSRSAVQVNVLTTEAPAARVSEDAPFKDRLSVTAQLGSVALGRGLAVVFDGQVQQHGPSEGDGDDGDDEYDGPWR